MFTSRTFLPLLLAVCVVSVIGCSPTVHPDPETLFTDYTGEAMPGAAVVVIKDGEVVFKGMYGLAELETGTPVTDSTNFRLASITKQFTALAVMKLIDVELIELKTPIRDYFPELPAFANPITVEHLLRHTSGLMDYESLMADSATVQVHDEDVLTLLTASPSLNFAPGTSYAYSNSGYALLALLVDRVTGTSFPQFLSDQIFRPLEMDGTLAFVEGGPSVRNRAFGYTVIDSVATPSDQSLWSAVLGDGGIYSSITDLMKWDKALDSGAFVSPELWALAYTPGLENYGFGWRIEEVDGHVRYSHTGGTSGFRNVIQRFPEEHLTIIILTNRADPDVEPIANQIAAKYLDE